MVDGIVTLTSANFDETIKSSTTPILVDFWAPWCGPCLRLSPLLTEIAKEQVGKVIIAKLNVDDHGDIAVRFDVRGIPTLMLFSGGEMKKRFSPKPGGKPQLLAEIAEFIPTKS